MPVHRKSTTTNKQEWWSGNFGVVLEKWTSTPLELADVQFYSHSSNRSNVSWLKVPELRDLKNLIDAAVADLDAQAQDEVKKAVA